MTNADIIGELESPPEIVAKYYPRFHQACRLAAARLRTDGRGGGDGKLEQAYKGHLDRIFDACGAKSVDEVIKKLNGGGDGTEPDGLHA